MWAYYNIFIGNVNEGDIIYFLPRAPLWIFKSVRRLEMKTSLASESRESM